MGRPKKLTEEEQNALKEQERKNEEEAKKRREEYEKKELNLLREQIVTWKSQNAELIRSLIEKGFKLDEREDQPSELMWFEKSIPIEIDLGEDIVDEELDIPQTVRIPKEILDKYGVSISWYSDFYTKRIYRKKHWDISIRIRLPIRKNNWSFGSCHPCIWISIIQRYSDTFQIIPSVEHEWRIEDYVYDLALVPEIEGMIAKFMTDLDAQKPKAIETLRNQIIQWKYEYKKAIVNAELYQFLYGALLQFDGLQIGKNMPKPKSTIEPKESNEPKVK